MKDSRKEDLLDSTYQAFMYSKEDGKILKIKIYDLKIENLVQENKLTETKKIIDNLKPVIEEINSEDLTQEYKIIVALYEIKNALTSLLNNQQRLMHSLSLSAEVV
jgi:two-component system, NarL family, sensor kinase